MTLIICMNFLVSESTRQALNWKEIGITIDCLLRVTLMAYFQMNY